MKRLVSNQVPAFILEVKRRTGQLQGLPVRSGYGQAPCLSAQNLDIILPSRATHVDIKVIGLSSQFIHNGQNQIFTASAHNYGPVR